MGTNANDEEENLSFQEAFRRKLAFFQARSGNDCPKSPKVPKGLWEPTSNVNPEVKKSPSNTTKFVISITDEIKPRSPDKTTKHPVNEKEDTGKNPKQNPQHLETIVEEASSVHKDAKEESGKHFSLFEIFEKLDHLIDSEMVDIAKTKPRKNPGLTQEITKNDDEFYDILRELSLNRDKFFQNEPDEKDAQKIGNGNDNDKSTPTDKLSFDQIPSAIKVVNIFGSDQLDHSPNQDQDSSPMTPLKRKRVVKVVKSVYRLEREIRKQEKLLVKINRVLDFLVESDHDDFADLVLCERHYLVSMNRIQGCLNEIDSVKLQGATRHKSPFDKKGTLTFRNLHFEVKPSYFSQTLNCENEFLVCLVKYQEHVLATLPIQILNDIRIVRFPETLILHKVFLDFEIRLEIYGTDNWNKRHSIRDSALKKYGFINLTIDDLIKKKFQLIESVPGHMIPIKTKFRATIDCDITIGTQCSGTLYVYCKDCWQKSWAILCGHIFKIWVGSRNVPRNGNFVIFDLRNSEADTVIPIATNLYNTKYTFRLDFNHYVALEDEDFSVLLAAEDLKSYIKWTRKINEAISLLKSK